MDRTYEKPVLVDMDDGSAKGASPERSNTGCVGGITPRMCETGYGDI